MTGPKATQGSHQLLVSVEVRDQDDVRMRSVGGRNWTPNATEMAQASGQDWVEQDSGLAILPGAEAVAPPSICPPWHACLAVYGGAE